MTTTLPTVVFVKIEGKNHVTEAMLPPTEELVAVIASLARAPGSKRGKPKGPEDGQSAEKYLLSGRDKVHVCRMLGIRDVDVPKWRAECYTEGKYKKLLAKAEGKGKMLATC